MPVATRSVFETFKRLDEQLKSGQRTFYTRYGDGEIFILRGLDTYNHNYDVKLEEEMVESITIEDSNYIKAMCVNYELDPYMENGLFTLYPNNDEMAQFLSDRFSPNKIWEFEHHFTLPYYAIFRPEEFVRFFDEHIRSKKKLFIGGVSKPVAEKLYGPIHEYVQTPIRHAYERIEEWWPEIETKLEKVDLIIPSAGMSSKILNKRFWKMGYPGNSLDVGALIDWVAGRMTRKWIRLMGHRINDVLVSEQQNKSISFQLHYKYRELYYNVLRKGWKKLRGKA